MKLMRLGILNNMFGRKIFHVEACHIFYRRLMRFCQKHKVKRMYCITPTNWEYINSTFGVYMPKEWLHKTLKEMYLSFKDMGIKLQPHVHISMFPKYVPFEIKEKMLVEAINFFRNDLQIEPKQVVFGWWAVDKDCIALAEKYNFKIPKEHYHLYDWNIPRMKK